MSYTVKEVANQIKRSETFVYDLLNKGVITKMNGVAPVKISKSELGRYKKSLKELPFNPDKVELIKTFLGDIRKIKGEDLYILNDLTTIAKVSSSWIIKERVKEEYVKLIPFEKTKELGLSDFNVKGALAITLEGIKEYLVKTRTKADWGNFIVAISTYKSVPTGDISHIKEKEIESTEVNFEPSEEIEMEFNKLQVIEQREVLGKHFKIYGNIENPLFLAKDVAKWIEYDINQVGKLLNTADEEEKKKGYRNTVTGLKEAWFLTEDGLYEVLMQSRKPIAKQFKKEVKKILKQIRLTGGYVKQGREGEFVDNYFSSFSEEIRRSMVQELETKNETLLLEKEKIENELLNNTELLKKIESSFCN